MRRTLVAASALASVFLGACGGGHSQASGTTTTTNADAYLTAYTVCLQLYNTDAARNAEPARMTDQAADDVFVGLALQLRPAVQKDPRTWAKLNSVATTLRRQLLGTSASDDQIESTISKFGDACVPARKAPATLRPPVEVPVVVSTTTSVTTPA